MVPTMRIVEPVTKATCGTCGQQFERHDHTGKPARESGDCPACLDAFQREASRPRFSPDHAGLRIDTASEVAVEYRVRGETARLIIKDEDHATMELIGPPEELKLVLARMSRKVFG
jgi:hypothetical protein